MIKYRTILVLACLAGASPAGADRNLHRLGWELTFNDEFDIGPEPVIALY